MRNMLDQDNKSSLFNCFRRVGVSINDFSKKVITYRMVSEALLDFRAGHTWSLGLD